VLPQENEAIAAAFSQTNPDFVPLDVSEILSGLKVESAATLCSGGDNGQRFLRLWPHRHQTDGFFAAVWQRQ
jgi:16S rRNA (cytosine967-C5)-methyltransferase